VFSSNSTHLNYSTYLFRLTLVVSAYQQKLLTPPQWRPIPKYLYPSSFSLEPHTCTSQRGVLHPLHSGETHVQRDSRDNCAQSNNGP